MLVAISPMTKARMLEDLAVQLPRRHLAVQRHAPPGNQALLVVPLDRAVRQQPGQLTKVKIRPNPEEVVCLAALAIVVNKPRPQLAQPNRVTNQKAPLRQRQRPAADQAVQHHPDEAPQPLAATKRPNHSTRAGLLLFSPPFHRITS